MALFPALIALVSLLGVLGPGQSTVDSLLEIIDQIGPSTAVETLRPAVEGLATSESADVGLVLGLLCALWSASATCVVGARDRLVPRVSGTPPP